MADNIDENSLVEQAKTDPEAFGQLYELHVEKIYNYIYYRLGNRHDAEDLTAKVFFKAINHIPHYKNKGVPFVAWLYRIAHNLIANWYRDQKYHPVVALDKVNLSSGKKKENPHYAAELTNQREILLAAIKKLSPERQQLLTLKFIEKMSNLEIGKVMGRSEGAIKSLYYRTLVSLKKLLAEHENLVNGLQLKDK